MGQSLAAGTADQTTSNFKSNKQGSLTMYLQGCQKEPDYCEAHRSLAVSHSLLQRSESVYIQRKLDKMAAYSALGCGD